MSTLTSTAATAPRPGQTTTTLGRLRWAVRAVLTLGVAASIAANILHANPSPISRAIAASPPLALLLTVELISRVPMHRRSLAGVRLAATAAIAGIAAWVSYWHLAGVASRYGETDAAASYLLPLSVDGLVVVASISLVEIAGLIRTLPHPSVQQPTPTMDDTSDGTETISGAATDAAKIPAASSAVDATRTAAGTGDPDESPTGTGAAVAYWHYRDPTLHPAQIATRIGRSERTVRRHWPPTRTAAQAVNGAAPASNAPTSSL